MINMFDITEELKKLPEKPGVYIMHDEKDEIIYVGKAIILKNRVRQYFQSSRNLTPKIQRMVSHIKRFEYIVTDSELEALVLECNLIKEHRPKYNTMLKDDKAYPYIKVTVGEDFPRVLLSHKMKKDKAKYFGPYTSRGAVRDSIELLQKIYMIRSCNKNITCDGAPTRSCLNYHIGQCSAPCEKRISKEEYEKRVREVLDFLNGNYTKVLKMLEEKMKECSEKTEYEEAAVYRDLLFSVRQIAQKQKITNSDMLDRDVIACSSSDNQAIVQVFFVRNGKLLGREHFNMQVNVDEGDGSILSQFIKQYYGGTPFIPASIMISSEIEDRECLARWLSEKRGHKVEILVPKKGSKEKLVELAKENAKMVLEKDIEKIKQENIKTVGAVKQICEKLGIPYAKRMEAFDISNISGTDSVGSMVVYEDGKPKKSDYRRFLIKWVKGANDYASMKEVLTRRFEHGQREIEENSETGRFSIFPELILMDGGRGQVNIALEVLKELGITIPVCGMVKDDNHRTRGLYYENVEIPIDRNSDAFRLITRIQDEAHRFAIEYHRSLRGKREVKSVLDDIEGIGPARRKSLMKHFGDITRIKEATVSELCKAEGITENIATNVFNFFH